MGWSPSSPITGGPQTNMTSPTYSFVADKAPDMSTGLQYAVTVAGGTQAGVLTHTASNPFTFTVERPRIFRPLGLVNPVTGQLSSVPMNNWKLRVRKGMTPQANQAIRIGQALLDVAVPAGCDAYDPANVRAMWGLLAGLCWQQSQNFGDSLVTGIFS